MAHLLVSGFANGAVLASQEGLSFWGGVDPASGVVMDAHHPLHQQCLAAKVLMLPTSRGSCTGSGVLLELIQNGHAPAALIFREAESVLTLGVLVAQHVFGLTIPVVRVSEAEFELLAQADRINITEHTIQTEGVSFPIEPTPHSELLLSDTDRAMLEGQQGLAVQLAMRLLCDVARNEGASELIDVAKVHIDGCIYAGPALLRFAQQFEQMGAKVRIPTTTNSISVDYANWRRQGLDEAFGEAAQGLADAYVNMGARATFTCAPYLLPDAPVQAENIAWAESNAVIYANTVLGARTAKHPDFLDLCIALTGRSPRTGMYLTEQRAALRIIDVPYFASVDDAFWPMLGYLAGSLAPDRIPLIRGVAHLSPNQDDLKALCGAFGTTSGAPMLHVADLTPEATNIAPQADQVAVLSEDILAVWQQFNPTKVPLELIALGSPHFSLTECRVLAKLLEGKRCLTGVVGMITLGRDVLELVKSEGLVAPIEQAGFIIYPDLCWCSISEPVFPTSTKTLMTNSGKYAHYGPGLSGRAIRFGSLAQCVEAATTGYSAETPPSWLI